jgi:hypothetical protein
MCSMSIDLLILYSDWFVRCCILTDIVLRVWGLIGGVAWTVQALRGASSWPSSLTSLPPIASPKILDFVELFYYALYVRIWSHAIRKAAKPWLEVKSSYLHNRLSATGPAKISNPHQFFSLERSTVDTRLTRLTKTSHCTIVLECWDGHSSLHSPRQETLARNILIDFSTASHNGGYRGAFRPPFFFSSSGD